nr:ABC transporter substrate-binding protein [Candidatus Acidianus copahuensis]
MKAISLKIVGVVIVVIIVIAIGVFLASFLASYHHKSKTVTLTVVTFSGQSAKFIQYAGNLFSSQHPGVKVVVESYPFSDYIEKELTSLEAHSSQYDIIGFTSTSAQRVAPYLISLNSSLFNMSDIIGPQEAFGGIIYNTTTHQNVTIGIAYETAVYLLAYRTNIFENSTLLNEFMNEYHINFTPTTWQNWTVVLDVDHFLTSHNITKYGFIIDDHVAHGIIDAFPAVYGWYYSRNSSLNHGLSGGLPGFNIMFEGYIPSGLTYPLPSFNSTSGIEALETYKDLISYEVNPSQLQICYGNFQEFYPNAPGAFIFTTQLSSLNSSELNNTALAPLPGGYAETGTDFLGVSKYSLHVSLAEEFLKFLVSPEVQVQAFMKFNKFPISKTAFSELISNSSISPLYRQWLREVYISASFSIC